jgi:hypothetical protein
MIAYYMLSCNQTFSNKCVLQHGRYTCGELGLFMVFWLNLVIHAFIAGNFGHHCILDQNLGGTYLKGRHCASLLIFLLIYCLHI